MFGVEIEKVIVTKSEANVGEQVFLCNVFCFNDIIYEHMDGRDIIPDARIQQLSKPTQCVEIDNTKISFYHESVTSYEIGCNDEYRPGLKIEPRAIFQR